MARQRTNLPRLASAHFRFPWLTGNIPRIVRAGQHYEPNRAKTQSNIRNKKSFSIVHGVQGAASGPQPALDMVILLILVTLPGTG
jgi:hypothetical protein